VLTTDTPSPFADPNRLDVTGLSWKTIADKMENVRTGADYARRWVRLCTGFTAKAKANGSDSQPHNHPQEDANPKANRRKGSRQKGQAADDASRQLVQALCDLVHPVSEVQDVVWVAVERAVGLFYGGAHRRFKQLVDQFGLKDSDMSFHDLVKVRLQSLRSKRVPLLRQSLYKCITPNNRPSSLPHTYHTPSRNSAPVWRTAQLWWRGVGAS